MDVALLAFGIGALIFLAHLFTEVFKKLQIPDVLFLVVIGIILGPITHLVDVSEVGVAGELFVILTLLIILFETGLDIKVKGLLSSAPRAVALMLLTLLVTVGIIILVGHLVFGFELIESILVGVLLGGVSAGIGIPLLEKLPISEKTRSLLTLEANINDVLTIGIVFAIIDFINDGVFSFTTFSVSLGMSILVALGVGAFSAAIWSQIISHIRGVQNNIFMTPALVLMVFGVTELLGASGIFAAFSFGITLGNLQHVKMHKLPFLLELREFSLTKWEKRMFSGFVFLLKTYFFVYIGLSIGLEDLFVLAVAFVVTVFLFLTRMLIVKTLVEHIISEFDASVLYRLLPKGLVGAALITLVDNVVVRDFTYGVILWSIVFSSVLIFLLPKKEEKEGPHAPDTTLTSTDPPEFGAVQTPAIEDVYMNRGGKPR